MSNLIHDEIAYEEEKSKGSLLSDNLQRTFSNYSQDKRRSVLKLTIDIDEPVYDQAAPDIDVEDVEDIEFSPDQEQENNMQTSPIDKKEDVLDEYILNENIKIRA
jgi:hypothetical protein